MSVEELKKSIEGITVTAVKNLSLDEMGGDLINKKQISKQMLPFDGDIRSADSGKVVTKVAKALKKAGVKTKKTKPSTGYAPVPSTSTKKQIAPKWRNNTFYRRDSKEIIPKFDPKNTWIPLTRAVAPAYVANRYYRRVEIETITAPPFTGDIYRQWIDHYGGMVSSAIESIESMSNNDTQKIDLSDFDADIGDIIGGEDYLTETQISQEVTNIIVKCKNGIEKFEYEVGGENE